MKYLCLGYFDRAAVNARPQSEIDAVMAECEPHMHKLYSTGHVIVDAGLDQQTKILERRNGEVLTMDGPFAETKEILGGAFLIEADNIDEAMRLAKIHPTTKLDAGVALGWRLEIHSVHYFKAFAEVPIG
jgi:hypothetical protein